MERIYILVVSHAATWIISSLTASSVVVGGMLLYSLSDEGGPSHHNRVSEYSLIPDLWVCRKNTNARGHEYKYAVNLINGSTGPARMACEGVKPINVSPMAERARKGPNGPRPPYMRVEK